MAGGPGCQTSSQIVGTDDDVAEPEQHELAPRCEVAVLVEDAVVREELLAVHALHAAVRAHERGVRKVAVEGRRADESDDPVATARHLVDCLARGANEPGTQQQVLRRIPGHGELRQDDEVRGRPLCVRDRRGDPLDVAVEVADDDVQLREGDPHRRILAARVGTSPRRGFRLSVTNITLPGWTT